MKNRIEAGDIHSRACMPETMRNHGSEDKSKPFTEDMIYNDEIFVLPASINIVGRLLLTFIFTTLNFYLEYFIQLLVFLVFKQIFVLFLFHLYVSSLPCCADATKLHFLREPAHYNDIICLRFPNSQLPCISFHALIMISIHLAASCSNHEYIWLALR